jgi:hypothetical protein
VLLAPGAALLLELFLSAPVSRLCLLLPLPSEADCSLIGTSADLPDRGHAKRDEESAENARRLN